MRASSIRVPSRFSDGRFGLIFHAKSGDGAGTEYTLAERDYAYEQWLTVGFELRWLVAGNGNSRFRMPDLNAGFDLTPLASPTGTTKVLAGLSLVGGTGVDLKVPLTVRYDNITLSKL